MSEHREPIYFPPRIILEGIKETTLPIYFKSKCNDCQSSNVATTFSFLTEKEMKEVLEKEENE